MHSKLSKKSTRRRATSPAHQSRRYGSRSHSNTPPRKPRPTGPKSKPTDANQLSLSDLENRLYASRENLAAFRRKEASIMDQINQLEYPCFSGGTHFLYLFLFHFVLTEFFTPRRSGFECDIYRDRAGTRKEDGNRGVLERYTEGNTLPRFWWGSCEGVTERLGGSGIVTRRDWGLVDHLQNFFLEIMC
jgi:hypothetical protein